MQNREISSQIQRINELCTKVYAACGNDLELIGHWSKYICILSAGLLENALPILFADVAGKAAAPHISSYVSHSLSKISNPKTAKFLDTAKGFKPEWEDQMKAFVEIDGRKEAIDTIMTNRHAIAHGKNSTISLVQIKTYLAKAIEVLNFIEGL